LEVIVDTAAIERNIAKAQKLVNVPISLMFKDFYDDISNHINIPQKMNVFGLHLKDSVCYSINKADDRNRGALVVSLEDYIRCYQLGIRKFYIPINAGDNREGLSASDADQLACKIDDDCEIHGLITSGCISDKAPSIKELCSIFDSINHIPSISLGGSYYLAKGFLPDFVSDIRIGEYMLFGTIPYDNCDYRLGENGITLETKVIETFTDRKQILIDCGYSAANTNKSKLLNSCDLSYIDSSSEYSIFHTDDIENIFVGDTISFIPDYKSLVKLRNAEIRYIR
jgi:hypothetical protein